MVLWHLGLVLLFAATIRVHSQFDSNGFLSIDCGLTDKPSYVDLETNLTFVSDKNFIDVGRTAPILDPSSVATEYDRTLRYFPNDDTICYTIRDLTVESMYLLRATFYYGNFDYNGSPPVFDIYLDVTFWCQVNTSSPSYPEIIFTATADSMQVCLINIYEGVPFISSLQLRQLKENMYDTYVSSTRSLILVDRYNLGASNRPLVRYPADVHDRWWRNYTDKSWIEISTNSEVATDPDETPTLVMQTAATTLTTKDSLFMSLTNLHDDATYCVILHFAEIQGNITKTDRREFTILGSASMINQSYIPGLSSHSIYFNFSGVFFYNISLKATPSSTLPPLLNAIELYSISSVEAPTYYKDVAAINYIKNIYNITSDWTGDPCLLNSGWSRVYCTTDSNNITRITKLYLSAWRQLTGSVCDCFGNLTALKLLNLGSNNLSGPIPSSLENLSALETLDLSNNYLSGNLPTSLGRLTALVYLDFSNNSLSGNLPSSLGQLTALKNVNLSLNHLSGSLRKNFGQNLTDLATLDLSYNDFSGFLPESLDNTALTALNITGTNISATLPPGLRKKYHDSRLDFRYGRTNPTTPSHKKNTIIAIAVVVPSLVIAIATAAALWLKRRKYNRFIASQPNVSYDSNRKFSYNELKRITNNFENNIGTGGYGSVYLGVMEDGVQVAVKVLSHSSKQGIKEFSAEAKNLTRVHHKNLVSLMGYCTDKNCMAIVYEYMKEGNILDKLKDKAMPLSWKQRLRIAYESALGLEYLHHACNPPLIHRDVKTSNILLNANLEAKVADFGLSRDFNNEASCRVLTTVVGTIGYLDPEYYSSNQLSAKSDVFSFGIVLLEIITGRPPIVPGQEGNLEEWVHQKLSEGDIQSIVDPTMQEKYDINSVWKVTNLACKCTEHTSSERPTMTVVVAELKESLDLEVSMEEMHNESTKNFITDVSHDSLEITNAAGISVLVPEVR